MYMNTYMYKPIQTARRPYSSLTTQSPTFTSAQTSEKPLPHRNEAYQSPPEKDMMHPPRQSPGGCSLASASSESHERKISIAPKLRCHYAYQKQKSEEKSEVSNKHIKYAYM